jgi:hypothetical protein
VFHFVWHLPFDLFGLGDPASSYATADITLRLIGARKPHHHDKVETHGGPEIQVAKISNLLWHFPGLGNVHLDYHEHSMVVKVGLHKVEELLCYLQIVVKVGTCPQISV